MINSRVFHELRIFMSYQILIVELDANWIRVAILITTKAGCWTLKMLKYFITLSLISIIKYNLANSGVSDGFHFMYMYKAIQSKYACMEEKVVVVMVINVLRLLVISRIYEQHVRLGYLRKVSKALLPICISNVVLKLRLPNQNVARVAHSTSNNLLCSVKSWSVKFEMCLAVCEGLSSDLESGIIANIPPNQRN